MPGRQLFNYVKIVPASQENKKINSVSYFSSQKFVSPYFDIPGLIYGRLNFDSLSHVDATLFL